MTRLEREGLIAVLEKSKAAAEVKRAESDTLSRDTKQGEEFRNNAWADARFYLGQVRAYEHIIVLVKSD